MVGSRARCGAESSGHCSFNRELGAPGGLLLFSLVLIAPANPAPYPGARQAEFMFVPPPCLHPPSEGPQRKAGAMEGALGQARQRRAQGWVGRGHQGELSALFVCPSMALPALPACPPVRPGSRLMLEAPGSSCPPLATPKLPSLLLQTRLPQEPWLRVETPPIQSLPQLLAQSS